MHVGRIKQECLKPGFPQSRQHAGAAMFEALLYLFLPYTSNLHISEASASKNDTGQGHLINIDLSRL